MSTEFHKDMEIIEENSNTEFNFRSLSDINTIFEFAKLERGDFKPIVQCVSFSEELDNEDIKLVELDKPVIETLMAGKKVEIRGDATESAVLVTEDCTFDLKEAETSNSLLLLPEMTFGCDISEEGERKIVNKQVCSVLHNYFELRPMKPKLKKLRSLLEEKPFKGKEWEEDEENAGKKYTWTDLCDRVQASDLQIKESLTHLNALEFDGFWRLLDFEHLTTVVHHIIQLCEERDWLSEGIDERECLDVLKDLFPEQIISHVLNCFTDVKVEENQMELENNRRHLNEDKICRHFAELCLRVSGKFNLNDFLKTWQESVPGEMRTSLSQLEGMALIDRDSKPEVIWFYNVEDLPESVAERFEALYEERKKWTLEEITPYIRDLTSEKMDVVALLTKYARSSLQNGIKVFSSKRIS